MLENKVQVSDLKSGNVKSNQGKSVDALALSKRWTVSSDRAKNTVRKKIQHRIRTVMNPQMSRRYPSNEGMVRYPRLPHTLFTDIMISGTVSKRGNKNAQVYGTSFSWTTLLPMKLNSDTHETLPLLFKRDGVPPEMIMDKSKEQLSRNFCNKLREANFHKKIIKPHPPWRTATKRNI